MSDLVHEKMPSPHLAGRPRPGVSLAIQAGGASVRMGENKALSPFGDSTLIEWILSRTAGLFADVFVVSNSPAQLRFLGVPVVTDAVPQRGSVVGIYSALLASPTQKVLCLACDLPLVPPRLLTELAAGADRWDAFVPRHGGFLEPLVAVYDRRALEAVERFLSGGGRRIKDLYAEIRTGYLDVDPSRYGDPARVFLNVNTPEELARAESMTGGRRAGRPGRSQAFLARSSVPVVSVVGRKKAGKTLVATGIVAELARRGYKVAALKHDRHGFEIDVPGTDTHRLRQAGAVATGISGPGSYAWIYDVEAEKGFEQMLESISEHVDLVVTEGYKHGPAPKIEVLGGGLPGDGADLLSPPDELLALVVGPGGGDAAVGAVLSAAGSVPRFEAPETSALAALIIEQILEGGLLSRGRSGT